LHIAAADGAPGFELLVGDIARAFGADADEESRALVPVQMDGYNSDWDTLYPFSSVRPLPPSLLPSSSPPDTDTPI
jgi:hypothetical protein